LPGILKPCVECRHRGLGFREGDPRVGLVERDEKLTLLDCLSAATSSIRAVTCEVTTARFAGMTEAGARYSRATSTSPRSCTFTGISACVIGGTIAPARMRIIVRLIAI
jgi:hypothetical protein